MEFRSQLDKFFSIFLAVCIAIVAAVTLLPIIIDKNAPTAAVIIMISFFLLTTAGFMWGTFSIKYVLEDNTLFVKGGPFRSRIPYHEITLVTRTSDFITGYRLMTAKNGIEIFYRTGKYGSVKISPKEQETFINELKKRCPEARFKL